MLALNIGVRTCTARLAGIMVNTVDPTAAALAASYGARVVTEGALDGHTGAVTVQHDGKTKHIPVTSQRLYTLADFGQTSVHTLKITFAPGTSAYAFTFG